MNNVGTHSLDLSRVRFTEEVIYKDTFKKIVKNSLNKQELKHLDQVSKLCERNRAKYFTSLEEVAEYLNKRGEQL